MFTENGYAIYVLGDDSVHLMPEFRQALLKKGCVLVVIGGGITGNIQINDTSCHHNLKKNYRGFEMNLMLEQLNNDPNKMPSPSRDEMMRMVLKAWGLLNVDTEGSLNPYLSQMHLTGQKILYQINSTLC